MSISYMVFIIVCIVTFFSFVKPKTAYEMRISDWSSDVCSSDLKIAPFASRRRYDCKRLHIADPVYPPIVINDGTAPSRWNHLIDRNILQWHEAASAIHLAPDPVEGRQDRPPHRVVRPE